MRDKRHNLNDAPFLKRGRWHKLFIESNGLTPTLSSCDLEDVELNQLTLDIVFPKDFHIVDYKFDINSVSEIDESFYRELRLYADGKQGLLCPNPDVFDYMSIYVFGYFA